MEIAAKSLALLRLGIRGLRAANVKIVLGSLVLAQLLALLAFALTVRHNGWLYYQGGDETFYYTTSWVLSGWHLPTTAIGYGWSYLLTPLALFVGPNVLSALPGVILLNALVLGPVSTLCVYGIGSRLGGRLLGYWAAALWIAAPYAVIPLWDQRYHQKWVELFLPQAFGLTNLGDFPSMVCLLVAALFCFRALDSLDWREGVIAGIATGFAIGIKPANALFLVAPALAFVLARRWRQALAFVVALAPAILTLYVWKHRGLGNNPALAASDPHLAYLGIAAPPLMFLHPLTRHLSVDWGHLGHDLVIFKEFFWSVRPLEYLPFAGLIAVAIRSVPKAAFLGSWFFAYLLVKGTSSHASVEDASFFRLMMPGYPAYFLLAVSLPLLVPAYGTRPTGWFPPSTLRGLRSNRWLVAAAVVFALVPLVFMLAIRPLRSSAAVKVYPDGVFLPIDRGFSAQSQVKGGFVVLRWHKRVSTASVFFRVFRARAFMPDPETAALPPIVHGIKCQHHSSSSAADCSFFGTEVIGTTATDSLVDQPPPGRWTYYVGMAANWLDDPAFGDVLLLSKPVTVTVRK